MISVLGVFNADLKFNVDHFPSPGETMHGNSFAVEAGGKGFNQAVAAKRAGVDHVTFLSALGDDEFGAFARSVMARETVDASAVFSNPQMPTGTAMIMVEKTSAQNMIVIAPGAANELNAQSVSAFEEKIAASELFMTNFEVPMEAVIAGLKLAKKHNVPTLVDPAPAQELPTEIYGLVDFLTPNETEAAALLGETVSDMDDAIFGGRELCERGLGTVIITMGEAGAVATNLQGHFVQEIANGVGVKDTTGAGDAFNGAFASALVHGADIPTAMAYGAVGAAICVSRQGAADAMGTIEEIEALLDKNPGFIDEESA